LGVKYPEYREALRRFRGAQAAKVLANPDPSKGSSATAATKSAEGKKHT
jgi:hypothetical protein